MTNPDEVKDKIYDDLDSVISATPSTNKFMLLGDFRTNGLGKEWSDQKA